MSRFTMALVAAAVAAIAAVAVVALPAIGDDGGSPNGFAACLRAHGLPGAPSDPTALKPWLASQEGDNAAALKAAVLACDPTQPDKPGKPAGSRPSLDADAVIACVRRQGIDAPTDPLAFKQWLAGQTSMASSGVRAALDACKISLDPGPEPGAEKCAVPPDKAPADKPQGEKPPAKSAPPATSTPQTQDGSV